MPFARANNLEMISNTVPALISYVDRDIEVIGEASNGEEAVAMTERLRPSLVLMDINMPKMSGVDATSHIKTAIPRSWSSACRYKRVMNHTWPC